MKKCIICLCLGAIIGFLMHSLWMSDKINLWKPVLEETSFQYLEYSVENIIKGVQTIEEDLKNSNKEQPDKILHHTMNLLLKLEYYYLPITQVRQQIYDADRLLSLNQVQKAKDNLARAETGWQGSKIQMEIVLLKRRLPVWIPWSRQPSLKWTDPGNKLLQNSKQPELRPT